MGIKDWIWGRGEDNVPEDDSHNHKREERSERERKELSRRLRMLQVQVDLIRRTVE